MLQIALSSFLKQEISIPNWVSSEEAKSDNHQETEKYGGLQNVIEGTTERFSRGFLEKALPLPTKNDDQVVLVSIKETRRNPRGGNGLDEDEVVAKIREFGFENVFLL